MGVDFTEFFPTFDDQKISDLGLNFHERFVEEKHVVPDNVLVLTMGDIVFWPERKKNVISKLLQPAMPNAPLPP